MKRIIFFLIGIFIFAYGCNDDSLPADAASENGTLKNVEVKMVPIKGEALVTHEYDDQGVALPYGHFSGYLTHLGELNEMKSTWIGVSNDKSQFPLISYVQDIVLCAANGDLVYATFNGVNDYSTFKVSGTLVLEGGTGRFENVSGQMAIHGYSLLNDAGKPEGAYLTAEGEISNVGSSK